MFSNMRPGAEEVDVHDRCFISLRPTGRLRSLSWPRPPVALGILTTCFCDLRPHTMINDDNFSEWNEELSLQSSFLLIKTGIRLEGDRWRDKGFLYFVTSSKYHILNARLLAW